MGQPPFYLHLIMNNIYYGVFEFDDVQGSL